MDPTARIVAAGLFFAAVLLSGIWLSRNGRPLNVVLSAVHKLVSLATGIYLLMVIYQRSRVVPLGSAEWAAITATGFCFLGAVVSGALLSSENPMPALVLRLHQVLPLLTLLSSAATLYLVLGS